MNTLKYMRGKLIDRLPFETRGFITPVEHRVETGSVITVKNVYLDLNGHIMPTPFAMPREGWWYFDGQVFYQPKRLQENPS